MAGAFAGIMSGVLGIGGGIIVVPALVFIFKSDPYIPQDLVMHIAAGTSLAVMILTSQASVRAHGKRSDIQWGVFGRLWPGVVVGVIAGGLLADRLPTQWLKIILGVFLLFVSVKMATGKDFTHSKGFPRPWINALVSFIIGLKSGLLGIGGGALIIPYLTYCGIELRKIAAVSALCTMTVAVIGTIIFMLTGLNEPILPPFSTGYVYWPAVIALAIPSILLAPVGAEITYRLPVKHLVQIFVVILFFTAINLLFF